MGGGGTVFTGGRGGRFQGGGSELTCSVARGYYHLGMGVLTCLEAEGTKVSETFSDRKIYLNTSFRLPVCSLRQVKRY
jgi:hypothetical protein